MSRIVLALLFIPCLMSACAPHAADSDSSAGIAVIPSATGNALEEGASYETAIGLRLPGTFTGTLPCADCGGIRHHLNLWPDRVYHLRRDWLGRDSPLARSEIGRWSADPVDQTITLYGAAEMPLLWDVEDPDELRMRDLKGERIVSSLDYSLRRNPELTPVMLESLFMGGEFTYMADAAIFMECLSRRTYPVAMEAGYLELERAYLDSRMEPGVPVHATIEGSILERPSMEGAPQPHVIVERLGGVDPIRRCEEDSVTTRLADTYWRITEIDGAALPRLSDSREPHMVFHDENGTRFSATVGCNQLSGAVEIDGDALRFGQMIATRMACPPPLDDIEQRLSAVLPRVASFRQDGDVLLLLDANSRSIASLAAGYFR